MIWFIIAAILVVLFGGVALFGAPYVPSRRRYVRRLFHHMKLIDKDLVVDLGSGDGVVLREAALFGARAVGFELNPILVVISRLLAPKTKRVRTVLANAWTTPFPDNTTVVYVFSVGRDEQRVVKTVQREVNRLGRPLRLVCLGNPLKSVSMIDTIDAYHIYRIEPVQHKTVTL